MVYAQDLKLKEHKINFLFTETQKDHPTKTSYSDAVFSMEAAKVYRDNEDFFCNFINYCDNFKEINKLNNNIILLLGPERILIFRALRNK